MNNSGILGDPLGKVGDLGGKVSKGVGDEAEKIEKTTKQQVVGLENQEETDSKNADNGQKQVPNMPSSKDTLEIVKKMYEKSNIKANIPSDQSISALIKENPKKTPEEIQKMATTRQQLLQQQHMTTYYEPTFKPKKKEEPRAAEAVAQVEEEKKQMEALELKKEEKKKEELSPTVKQGTHEINPGVSG